MEALLTILEFVGELTRGLRSRFALGAEAPAWNWKTPFTAKKLQIMNEEALRKPRVPRRTRGLVPPHPEYTYLPHGR